MASAIRVWQEVRVPFFAREAQKKLQRGPDNDERSLKRDFGVDDDSE